MDFDDLTLTEEEETKVCRFNPDAGPDEDCQVCEG